MAQLVFANQPKDYIFRSFLFNIQIKVVPNSIYVLVRMLLGMLPCYQTRVSGFFVNKFDKLSASLRKRGC